MQESPARRELLMFVLTTSLGMLVAFLSVVVHFSGFIVIIIVGVGVATLIGAHLSRYPLAGALIYCIAAAGTTAFLPH